MLRGKNTPKDGITDALIWDTEPFKQPVELIGPFVLHLDACSTAPDTDWIVKLCDAAPDGTVSDLTQGWLRASHRAVDPQHSKPYRPYHPFDQPQALISGEVTRFEIEILPTAQRFAPGHCLRLILTSSDTQEGFAMQGIAHAPLGIGARNTVVNTSRLTVPLVSGSL
jgi:putative CocE/NonD family hydrolase